MKGRRKDFDFANSAAPASVRLAVASAEQSLDPRGRTASMAVKFPKRPDLTVLSETIPLFYIGQNRHGFGWRAKRPAAAAAYFCCGAWPRALPAGRARRAAARRCSSMSGSNSTSKIRVAVWSNPLRRRWTWRRVGRRPLRLSSQRRLTNGASLSRRFCALSLLSAAIARQSSETYFTVNVDCPRRMTTIFQFSIEFAPANSPQ